MHKGTEVCRPPSWAAFITSVFDVSNVLMLAIDREGRVVRFNRACERASGYTFDELKGRPIWDLLFLPEERDEIKARIANVKAGDFPQDGENCWITKDGRRLLTSWSNTAILAKDGSIEHIAATGIDITERRRSEKERNRLEARFRSMVQHSSDVIAMVSTDLVVDYISPSVSRVLGHRAEELIGRDLPSLLERGDRSRVVSFLTAVEADDAARSTKARLRAGDGSWRDVEIVVGKLLDDPAVGGIVLTIRDVTERLALERQLTFQAFHDPLTELANRTLFADRLEYALSTDGSRAGPVAVLFIDLDDFKTVNDSLGHEAGDRLLVAIGERLSGLVRPDDTCARLGGDEFGVLLEGVAGTDDAVEAARRARARLCAPVSLDGRELSVSVSIGVAVADRHTTTVDTFMQRADAAMYAAKREGLQGVRLYEPSMHRAALTRLELKGDLERALAHGEFVLRFQPLVELETGRVAAVEALARWDHPHRGLLGAEEFIDLAEETGLIVPLGRSMFAAAASFHRELLAGGLVDGSFALSVNVSTRELDEPDFAEDFARWVDDSGLDSASVILEVTERALVRDPAAAVLTLKQLRTIGVRIAVDDFGTGYSSLSTLQSFPVDILKIAKPFIDDITSRRTSLADAIVRLGSTLGLDTVAEGIESEEQARRLRQLGCRYGQGFHLARPLSPDDLVEHLRRAEASADAGDEPVSSAA